MPFRLALAGCAALCVLIVGSTASAAEGPRSDSQALRDAVFARAPRADTQADAGRFATWRPKADEAAGRDRIETERSRSDLKAMAPGTAMHAGFRLKF